MDVLLSCLGKMGMDSVLVEGGAELDWSIVEAGLVDEVYCFIAPKVIGGGTAKGILVHAFPSDCHSGTGHDE